MEERFEIDELIVEAARFRKLAALCEKHGNVNGATAARAIERSISAELDQRYRDAG